MNFYGIYNFKCNDDFNLSEKFEYPKCIRRELDYWYKAKDCMERLLSSIFDKYLLVKQYKNNVQLIEGNGYLIYPLKILKNPD